jgi:hypothetical protein
LPLLQVALLLLRLLLLAELVQELQTHAPLSLASLRFASLTQLTLSRMPACLPACMPAFLSISTCSCGRRSLRLLLLLGRLGRLWLGLWWLLMLLRCPLGLRWRLSPAPGTLLKKTKSHYNASSARSKMTVHLL